MSGLTLGTAEGSEGTAPPMHRPCCHTCGKANCNAKGRKSRKYVQKCVAANATRRFPWPHVQHMMQHAGNAMWLGKPPGTCHYKANH